MANRSYLYSIGNRPESCEDRPETISGLSEWPYAVPFSYRVLMSGDPRLCASLISDGFEDDPPERRTRLYAISGDFDTGHARLTRFCAALRVAGAAVDALPDDPAEAGAVLAKAASEEADSPLAACHGLVLDDGFDNTRDRRTEHPIGLSWWTDVLYFALSNRADFAANA